MQGEGSHFSGTILRCRMKAMNEGRMREKEGEDITTLTKNVKAFPKLPQKLPLRSHWPEQCHRSVPSCKGNRKDREQDWQD